ncbi:MAG: HEAT repeat domain-containing protein [Planctomycetaceae bacterium]|nr:HEAT repeat domain-containing protein [Planctomycetaceae bacterium]
MKNNHYCPLLTAHSLLEFLTTLSLLTALTAPAFANDIALGDHNFTLPDGFTIEQVAGPPLVNRPICADFDEQGRLYVADSSGSNENVQTQLEQKPHRIVRLEDTDGDGTFEKSVVFAGSMMFPEGAMWFDGSLYVSAPPVIWKLTDTDDDGEADLQEEWFDAKTLTGCANDLHGPYLGPDGWIYWCKGAFAEQTYERPGREPFVTRASHIFRRRPEGGPIEPVMTGGMDNPVEVVFTPGGERIFSTTFLVRPGGGLRDGLIHAIYGGVYGKNHGVLEGHPRTGELMPVLSHLGPAAPCGLLHLESDQLGDDYPGNVLCCLFNMHRLTRHVLTPDGATFESKHEDFLVSDNIDFHPTDVLEDADGSLVVVNTGGWYKLCCPTSNLHKPDILGAIYRIKRTGSHQLADGRGLKLDWESPSTDELVSLLGDPRHAVRERAKQTLGKRGEKAVAPLREVLRTTPSVDHRRQAVWTLSWIDHPSAREAVRVALTDEDETVRHAAVHIISVWQDQQAVSDVVKLLQSDSPHNQRAAAEALGRIGSADVFEALLEAVPVESDRILEHSLTYALIEIGDASRLQQVQNSLHSTSAQRIALIARDQIGEGNVSPAEVLEILASTQGGEESEDVRSLHESVWWIIDHHSEWADDLVEYFRTSLEQKNIAEAQANELSQRLARFVGHASIQEMMANVLSGSSTHDQTKTLILHAMVFGGLKQLPAYWQPALATSLDANDVDMLDLAVRVIAAASETTLDEQLIAKLRALALDGGTTASIRLRALLAIPQSARALDSEAIQQFVCDSLSVDQPLEVRSLAVDLLKSTPLDNDLLIRLTDAIPTTGPMELQQLIEVFKQSSDESDGVRLLDALTASAATTSLPVDKLKDVIAGYGETTQQQAEALFARIEQENRDKYQQLEAVLDLLADGDIRRGQRVFHGTKVACIGCHTMGYLGGRVGPDLSRVGRIRNERDLLEAILFPSASFVRSYEPTTVLLADGRVLNGVIKDETSTEISLQIDAQKLLQIPLSEIEERLESKVSIMPAGLDKQLTPQQLADLVTFLKAAQ